MREIEIKVRVANLEHVVTSLTKAGITLSVPKEQHDVVYCLPGAKGNEGDPNINWLRIRTQDKSKVFFTLKRSAVSGSSLDSIEHETVVTKGEELETMLRYMGYIVYSDLLKIRRTGHVGDIEICVDDVPPLGGFVELEKLCEDDVDPEVVERQLLDLLSELGIAYEERIHRGYDELMNDYLARKE